ncbi:MAG: Rrf2 family transcriptional regulator [Vicinamibacteria bacterium]
MKLSSQEEYGLRCLLQVARRGESLTIAELSKLEGISSANVAKILRVLRRGGFLTSTRGQAGGYTLARPADEIAVGDVLATLGGRLFHAKFCETHAGASSSCTHLGDCSIRPVLRDVQRAIDDVLGRLTLKSLLCSEREVALGPRAVPLPLARQSGAPG